jgi:hypothetical protein
MLAELIRVSFHFLQQGPTLRADAERREDDDDQQRRGYHAEGKLGADLPG